MDHEHIIKCNKHKPNPNVNTIENILLKNLLIIVIYGMLFIRIYVQFSSVRKGAKTQKIS